MKIETVIIPVTVYIKVQKAAQSEGKTVSEWVRETIERKSKKTVDR